MSKSSFKSLSWALWGIFVFCNLAGIGIFALVSYNFTFSVNNLKLALLFCSSFLLIFSATALAVLIILTTWNATRQNDQSNLLNILLWVSMFIFVSFNLSLRSSLTMGEQNDQTYLFNIISIFFSIFNLIFLPLLVFAFLQKNTKNKILDFFLICFLILQLFNEFITVFILFFKTNDQTMTLTIYLVNNLLFSTIFYGLLTKKSVNSFHKNN